MIRTGIMKPSNLERSRTYKNVLSGSVSLPTETRRRNIYVGSVVSALMEFTPGDGAQNNKRR